MTTCPRCGCSNNDSVGYCFQCGFNLAAMKRLKGELPSPQARESYAGERRKFIDVQTDGTVVNALNMLDRRHPIEALGVASELLRLCQLRANEAALAREERLA